MMQNIIQTIESKYTKKNIPDLKPGDVIKVHQKVKEGNKERIQIFEGMVIRVRGGKSLSGSFTVRRISYGIGIERVFPLHSPSIIKIEKTKSVKVRRARLYYLRNLIGKAAKKRKELKEFAAWEEPEAEKEEEALKAKLEAEAKAKEEEKQKEQEELDKKFAAAKGTPVTETKEEAKDDKAEEVAGK
jgi:large subunit ribosomal protein L19